MRILKIPVWWTPQEAECVMLLLDELCNAISHTYGDEIQQMHQEQDQNNPTPENDWNDKVPF